MRIVTNINIVLTINGAKGSSVNNLIDIDGYGALCRIHTGQLINRCDLK